MDMRNVSQMSVGILMVLGMTFGCLRSGTANASVISSVQKPSRVEVVGKPGNYQLLRDGKPYFIKGVGGNASRKLLLEIGGNSFRTWGADNIGKILDDAHKDELTVTVGIWLQHASEFDYNNKVEVKKQFEMCKKIVEENKDHPALLMWAFGNEMEANPDNIAVWHAVEEIAAMSKKIDPNHPTMTVLAEIGGDKIANLHKICKSIDIVGINSYGGAPSLKERYPKAGGTKPYIVTEFGPLGQWEVPKTRWDAPIEPTSTEKAEWYKTSYIKAVKENPGTCLGSYAFLWGNKQEATSTWFGMVLHDGSPVAAVDVMAEFWGKPRKNLVPKIEKLEVSGIDNLIPGEEITATLKASDPEGKPLKVKWIFVGEGKEKFTAGRDEPVPESFPGALVSSTNTSAKFKMPTILGGYRVFAYVFDDAGGAATANVPVFVSGTKETAQGTKTKIPLTVYADSEAGMPFAPTGWMGDTASLKTEMECKTQPRSGKNCIKFAYSNAAAWVGVVFQHPANDWGELPAGLDLSGAKKLSFWARGEKGGEKVKIEFGILKGKKYFDTDSGVLEVTLTDTWKQFSLDLAGKDLKRIKSGFVFVMAGNGAPQTVYVDDVVYE